MHPIRLIPRLDIKGSNLIKGIHLEGFRKIGDPSEYAQKYYKQGADELIYYDVVASLYNRNSLLDIIEKTASNIFIPLTVGGGIRSSDDVYNVLRAGADKISINTGAVKNKLLISEIAERFGSQCCVLEVQAKRKNNNTWEAFIDNGREHTGLDVLDWVEEAVSLGAGEILITSIDQEGTGNGYDTSLLQSVAKQVSVPVIASGGVGSPKDVVAGAKTGVNACSFANIIHYEKAILPTIRQYCQDNGLKVRSI